MSWVRIPPNPHQYWSFYSTHCIYNGRKLTESVYDWRSCPNIDKNSHQMHFENSPLSLFLYALKSSESKRQYPARLKKFFDFIQIETTPEIENKEDFKNALNEQSLIFLKNAKNNESWVLASILSFMEYLKNKQQKGQITAGTIKNYYRSIKLFCEMNDLNIRWKKITVGLPKARNSSNDRATTIEEIKKLLEYPDRRLKAIVSVMMSSGIRLGAWDYLKWSNVIPLYDSEKNVIAAKLIVYCGEPEEYFTFITAEAYSLLKEWINFRKSYGEKIDTETWLMRDIWQTTNINYGAKWGLATVPRRLESVAIKRIIDRALRIQGIRTNLNNGQKRHEFKAVHGFRKFFKTRTEQIMKPIHVELLMGHSTGISDSYYRPKEKEILDDYLKTTDSLTINSDNLTLKKQVLKLEEENKNGEYVIQGKLHEKDEQIKHISEKHEQDIKNIKEEMDRQFLQIMKLVQQNPVLAQVKPEILKEI